MALLYFVAGSAIDASGSTSTPIPRTDCTIESLLAGDAGSTTTEGLTSGDFDAAMPSLLAGMPGSEWYWPDGAAPPPRCGGRRLFASPSGSFSVLFPLPGPRRVKITNL
jgi:hypothetical protein